MSGHSKWSTIKRQKGVADIKRGQTFTKIANAITIAVRQGGSGDPDSNPRLRMAAEAARAVNMPKENVQRAIDRGLGKVGGVALEEVTYEGFGPGRVAFLVEGVTDNKLRTLQEIKNLFERSGGILAGQGSVAYMFEVKGVIRVKSQESRVNNPPSAVKSLEEQELELIDLGAEDIESFQEKPFDLSQGKNIQRYLVYTDSTNLNNVSNKITQAGYTVESEEHAMKPRVLQKINDKETADKVMEFAQRLEEMDDVQKVFANFDIDEKLIS